MDHRDDSVGDCLRRIAAGGEDARQAIAALYRAYRRPILAFLLRAGVAPQTAEDVLQTTFLKIAEHAAQWKGSGSASAWLWAIVRNVRIDFARAGRLEIRVDDDHWQQLGDEVATDAGNDSALAVQHCVTQAFERFAADYPARAEALRLLHLEQWSVAEVAAYIGRTTGATKEFLSQCRQVFKPYLQPCLELLER